jgi:hypothetical protein
MMQEKLTSCDSCYFFVKLTPSDSGDSFVGSRYVTLIEDADKDSFSGIYYANVCNDSSVGICHANPPQLVSHKGTHNFLRPIVDAEDLICSKYHRRLSKNGKC